MTPQTAGRPSLTITGPITGGRGWPYGGAVIDLDAYGYVEEDYFLEGEARSYAPAPGTTLGEDGRWTVRVLDTASFKTRIRVARPKRAADFTGNVILSWQNVSAGFEIGAVIRQELRRGDAFVAVSAQKVGLDGFPGREQFGLRAWDPVRYGSLHHPGDAYSYDMFTAAARSVGPDRGPLAVDPMGGLEVKRVFATGGSQGALRLTSYLNAIQPLEHALDGVQMRVGFGAGAPMEKETGTPSMRLGPTLIRDDLDIPVIIVTTETEAPDLYPMRQPDTDHLRIWEIAGADHAGAGGTPEMINLFKRDGLPLPPALESGPASPSDVQPNTIAYAPVTAASWTHLIRWASGGAPPPVFDLIEFAGDPPQIQRDENGNARGGLRLPEIEVPIGTYTGRGGSGALSGATAPFPAEKLRRLYRNRADYLAQFEAAVQQGVTAGYYLKEDADDIVAAAAKRWGPLFPD